MIDVDKFLENLIPAKLFIIGILINGLFWYLSIFLFANQLIYDEPFQIPIIIAICLSFLWFCLTVWESALRFKNSQPYVAQNLTIKEDSILWNIFSSSTLLGFFVGVFKIIHVFIIPLNSSFKYFSFSGIILICFGIACIMTLKQVFKSSKREKEHTNKVHEYYEQNIKPR